MTQYPSSELVEWQYPDPQGRPTYYADLNKPIAVVLHTAEGYESTIRQWAAAGMYGRSWHYTVCDDGRILCHLPDFADGGYHAGITAAQAVSRPPTWKLWRGPYININHYTIGIEHTGFHGDGLLYAQAAASKKLCQWLAAELGIPFDRDHFPPHADIDLVNRVNDFDTPAWREVHYKFLFEPEDAMGMNGEELARLERLERLVGGWKYTDAEGNVLVGEAALNYLDRVVNRSLAEGQRLTDVAMRDLDAASLANAAAELLIERIKALWE